MNLRRLNNQGIERFSAFVNSLTGDTSLPYPSALLTDPGATAEIHPPIEIEQRSFGTRYAAAEYLFNCFEDSALTDIERDSGLWAWLALFYFNQLCPTDKRGSRKPGERARWIPAFSDARRYYRHLLAGPYHFFKAHRDAPQHAMVLLYGPLGTVGHFYYQLVARQPLVTNKSIVELATEMYIDPEAERPKRGARTSGKPGTVFRFVAVLQQLDTTWDLYAMSKDQIAALLPQEFSRFRKT